MGKDVIKVIDNIGTVLEIYTILDRKVFKSNNSVINNTNNLISDLNSSDLSIIETFEGKEKLELHIKKERDPYFMKKCKENYKLRDKNLSCQICGFSFYKFYGDIGKDFVEGHHTKPISELKEETKISINDILFVCSNCHRMIHRKNPPLTEEKLKSLIQKNKFSLKILKNSRFGKLRKVTTT